MKKVSLSYLFMFVFSIINSCTTGQLALKQLPDYCKPQLSVLHRGNETTYSASFSAGAMDYRQHQFIRSVDSVYFELRKGHSIIFDEKSSIPTISGLALDDGNASVTLNTSFSKRLVSNNDLVNTTLRMKIFTKEGQFYYDISTNEIIIHNIKEKALSLTPFFLKSNTGAYSLGVEAFRNYTVEGEYIPDSQILIARITSRDGKLIWDSSNSKNFMQMITKVLPENPGEIYKYELFWDGKDMNGNIPQKDTYTINFIIPAQPESYSATLDIEWK